MENEIKETSFCEATARELCIVELRSQGMTNGEIAAKLFISKKTVEVHMVNLLKKYIQARNGCGLCCMFLRNGWIK